MSRLIFSLLPRTRNGGEFLSPRQQEPGQFRFMRMRPSRVRWSCYKRGSTEYRTKGRGAKARALPSTIVATAWYITTALSGVHKTIRTREAIEELDTGEENCFDSSEESASGRLGGEVGLADGVCRGSDQRQMRKLLDRPLPGYARRGSFDCVSVRFTNGTSAQVTDYSNGNYS